MSNSLKRLSVIIYCIIPFFLNAQNFRAEAKVDSNHILIGDHLTFQLSFTGDNILKYYFLLSATPVLKELKLLNVL